ncbi:hypothetical protein NLX86_25465 [Streptomyces sp. A3M-1-3]|uniref:hypothetical protein n=1 Tax=Streptomyces sp. A3M-1-3 TaxID=2962044 RepID=UPI0020B72402|nr:hypothetical protein [Streptomyces sp. A3M-1-3]MCP3821322.1 hypothetical protein [Streptomyces sp. A3M-1-3]
MLRAVAIASCVPYLALKIAWIAGSRIGIPEGSVLLDHRMGMIVANGVTVLMDACVIVLALLLTQAWGRRVPAWLPALPMWFATGLLAPIMTGYPLQLLVRAFGGTVATASNNGREPFLDEWVFAVVYPGFIIQGLTLGTLFVLYARDRWGHLWSGRMRELPSSPTRPAQQAAAVAAAVLALLPAAMHMLWACGGTAGLGEARIEDRTSDFYALEAVFVLFAALTVAGVLMLAFRRGRALPLKAPLAMAWLGSSALACWGGWMLTASVGGDDPAENPTQLMNLTYSAQMIVGMLVVTIGAYFFAERAAAARRNP